MRASILSYMSKGAGVLVLLLACSSPDEALERLPPPPAPEALWPPPPPPLRPPPLPPPLPSSQPPPPKIETFLREHAADTAVWRATVYQLANRHSGRSTGWFQGHRIARQTTLGEPDAAELAARLGREASYVDGDIGCFLESGTGYRVARGDATLDFLVNCGHVSFDGVDWHAAVLSPDMMEFLDRLEP